MFSLLSPLPLLPLSLIFLFVFISLFYVKSSSQMTRHLRIFDHIGGFFFFVFNISDASEPYRDSAGPQGHVQQARLSWSLSLWKHLGYEFLRSPKTVSTHPSDSCFLKMCWRFSSSLISFPILSFLIPLMSL